MSSNKSTEKTRPLGYVLGVWWVAILFATVWAPYLGSWFGRLGSAPIGAVIRDGLLSLSILMILAEVVFLKPIPRSQLFVLGRAVAVSALVISIGLAFSDPVGFSVGIRVYALFPFVYVCTLRFVSLNTKAKKIIEFTTILNFFLVALIGVLDVVSFGELSSALGYSDDFAGGDFSLITSYDGLLRANGGFGDALNFGYFVGLGVFVSAWKFFSPKPTSILLRCIYLVIMLTCVLAAVMSLTRGAIMCAVVGVLVAAGRRGLRSCVLTALMGILIGVFAIVSLGYDDILLGRFLDTNTNSAGSSEERVKAVSKSIDVLTETVFGLGVGSQGAASRLSNVDNRIATDNYFLWIWVEVGLIFGTVFIGYIFSQFFHAWKFSSNQLWVLGIGLMVFIAAALSSAPTSALYAIYFWALLPLSSPTAERA